MPDSLKEMLASLQIDMMQADDFNKFLNTVGSELQALRTARKLDLETVAQQINMPLPMLAQIEAGQFNWQVEIIMRIRQYYRSVSTK